MVEGELPAPSESVTFSSSKKSPTTRRAPPPFASTKTTLQASTSHQKTELLYDSLQFMHKMEGPVSTPRLPAQSFKRNTAAAKEQLLSSSPGFGTPAYPIASRQPAIRQPFAPPLNNAANNVPTVLSILLPPQTLRPVAFRTLTKKHNLTLTSSGLGLLSTFVGKFCGSGWREEGLAERVLDEIAKTWKRNGGGLIIEDGPDKKLSGILKLLEPCMSGGRLDTGKLSRTNSSVGGSSLSRSSSLVDRPGMNRDDSQTSLGLSGLNVEEGDPDGEDHSLDIRSYLKVISAFDQPKLLYSMAKKTLEPMSGSATLLPPIQHKISMFRNRYHLVHQRLMRNESFQTPSFSTSGRPPSLLHSGSSAATLQQAYKITPISNLLGRSGSSHLLLGLLVHSAAGDLSLTDLSGSVVLDLSIARPIPANGAWFCPGMIVLVEGTYQEDGSHSSNLGAAAGVGGQIKGQFIAETVAGPPAERRGLTIGSSNGLDAENMNVHTSVGAGFGWIDFLGVGSDKGVGSQMRRLRRRFYSPSLPNTISVSNTDADADADAGEEHDHHLPRTKIAILAECTLDSPRTLEAIRAILSSYNTSAGDADDLPLSVVLMGNFVSTASMAGSTKGGSVEYKEAFDALASILSDFPFLLANTTFVFVPGDNDPWASSFSSGGACVLPGQGVPEVFTSRIRRTIASANSERKDKDKDRNPTTGDVVWTSNPARLSLFGPLEEIVLFRDDITSRFRRNAVTFSKPEDEDEDELDMTNDQNQDGNGEFIDSDETHNLDRRVHEATSHLPQQQNTNTAHSTQAARKLIKTILDQSHLAPFTHSIRPVFWDHAASLSLYPLPTALVLADAEMPGFAISYEGCHVMNPGRVVDELALSRATGRGCGVGRWVEFDVMKSKGEMREVRF
ncbi:DNA-directed DNA polymerase epsilon, subunit B [Exophiala xenobiotica]|nr:DNA-directed DNA polymerase epsilon, subunit B [Exophiala xenobiotica]